MTEDFVPTKEELDILIESEQGPPPGANICLVNKDSNTRSYWIVVGLWKDGDKNYLKVRKDPSFK
jgi:hypothetical protein